MTTLFDPVKLGDLELPNRIIMAPLTRCRASEGRVPNAMMAEYYQQRAGAGLIISEATSVMPMGVGYPNTPGIWSEAQVNGWKLTTEAVHAAGGKILLQLWHVGRISDPIYLDGEKPVSASAIAAKGQVSLLRPKKDFVEPRALDLYEIPDIIEAYRQGAENAKKAGFDGVEIHGANGYLLDQFLQSGSNKRTDVYGGSIENRARLLLEATDAAISVWGAGRVGVHLAPRGDTHDMGDDDLRATFHYVAEQLGERKIAFICTRENFHSPAFTSELKKIFKGAVIANEAFDQASGSKLVEDGIVDAVAWGKLYISNPDLVERFKHNDADLTPFNVDTFHSPGPHGYTDYPTRSE